MIKDNFHEKIALLLSFLILNNYLFLSLNFSQLLIKINFIIFLLIVLIFYFKNFSQNPSKVFVLKKGTPLENLFFKEMKKIFLKWFLRKNPRGFFKNPFSKFLVQNSFSKLLFQNSFPKSLFQNPFPTLLFQNTFSPRKNIDKIFKSTPTLHVVQGVTELEIPPPQEK